VAEVQRLPLETHDGRPLANKFYAQEEPPGGLLITLPGNHYGVDGPLLYYPSEVLWDSGWDTLAITYGYQTAALEFSHEVVPGVLQECQAALEFIQSKRDYPRIGLVGKSLGCFVIVQLCSTLEGLEDARCVYLTPPIGTPFFDQLFPQTTQPAHLAMGTADRFYNSQALDDLKDTRPFDLTLIEGADHSMDVAGDLKASLDAMGVVTQAVTEFLLEE
jgi:dienelactone hydrolase